VLQFHVLGGGGYIPNDQRETSAFLLVKEDQGILLDLGTGISQLLRPYYMDLLSSLDKLTILLSHYHLDHLAGLTWLPKFCTLETEIIAPAPPLLEGDPVQALQGITSPPFFSLPLSKFPFPLTVTPFSKTEFEVAGIPVSVLAQRHSGGSVGYRLGDQLAYVTDTDPTGSDAHAAFIDGVHTFATDTMYDAVHYTRLASNAKKPLDHGYSVGAAELAARSNVQSLVLMHLPPDYDEGKIDGLAQEAREIFPNTRLAEDCTCIDIP
jgi:ribonuclease BN (tRNA processing enzyme)